MTRSPQELAQAVRDSMKPYAIVWNEAEKALSELVALAEAGERAQEALRRIAENGGWETVWLVDEAEPETGSQPSIVNRAQDIARAALGEGS